jgi:predicted acylesterase/phospholipase RssA
LVVPTARLKDIKGLRVGVNCESRKKVHKMKPSDDSNRIGLALSGGGHRATLFALGVLLYLADSNKCKNVSSISSVSGGSITNAFLSLMHMPFNQMDSSDFEEYAARLARQIAGRPVYFWVSIITYIAILILYISDIVFNWHLGGQSPVYPMAAALTPLLLSVLLGPRSLGTLWSWWGMWAYVGLIFAIFIMALWLELPIWARIAGIGTAASSFFFRPIIAGVAIGQSLEECSGWSKRHTDRARLDVGLSPLIHVICATDMHDGEHVFFCTNDVVYSPSFGIGTAGDLKLRAAVQASANFPGAFPPRFLFAKRHNFEGELISADRRRTRTAWEEKPPPFKTLILTDGGVRDNTGLNWHIRRELLVNSLLKEAERSKNTDSSKWVRNPERMLGLVSKLSNGAADHVIVVNAAYTPTGWTLPFSWVPLIGELISLFKLPNIFYHRTNRRLVQEFRRELFFGRIQGAMISIDDTPLNTAGYIVRGNSYVNFPKRDPMFLLSSFASRAEKVLDYDLFVSSALCIENADTKMFSSAIRYFNEIVAACRDEGTHLNPIGRSKAAKLMFHGYTLAMANLKILDDSYPLLKMPQLADFGELAMGRSRN